MSGGLPGMGGRGMTKNLLVAGLAAALLGAGLWLASDSEDEARGRPNSKASSSPETAEADEVPDPRLAASEILSLRAQAVMDDDRDAFLSSIDPGARRFRKQQAKVFDRLTSLRLGSYELRLRMGEKDRARRKHVRHYRRADDVFIPSIEERYRFKRYDDADFVGSLFFTFVLRDGEWLIAADDDLKGRSRSERNLWDFGPVKQTRGRNVTVIQHPCHRTGCVEVGRSFLQLAENARRRVKERWRERWNGRVVVLVTSSRSEVRKIIDVNYGISNFVAFAYTRYLGTGYSPARIVVDRATLAERSPDVIELVLTHEMAHVATRRASGPHIPLWVEEGLAEWVARPEGDDADRYYEQRVATGAVRPTLATDRQIRRGDADELFLHYQGSRTAVAYFIERWGYKRFVRFYKLLGDSHNESGGRAKHLRSTLRRVTGLTPRQFAVQWADSI
ncbi:MAG: hypothetical protein ACRDJL_06585 [Actinomycetota bacterium]